MKKSDKIIGLLIVLSGILVILLSTGLPQAARKGIPGPALLPQLVAGAMILCGILLFFRAATREDDAAVEFNREARKRLVGVILLAMITAVCISYIGFILTCLVSSFVFLVILGTRMKIAAPTAGAITLGIYLVFHYGLQVQFPHGTVW
jgi:hypothetical protein